MSQRQGDREDCTHVQCLTINHPVTQSASPFMVVLLLRRYNSLFILLIIYFSVTLPPSDVSVVHDELNSILLSWTPSSNAIGYIINYASSCRGGNQHSIHGGSTDEYRVTGLEDGGIYTISIVAISDGFPSDSVIETITLMGVDSGKIFFRILKRYYQNNRSNQEIT